MEPVVGFEPTVRFRIWFTKPVLSTTKGYRHNIMKCINCNKETSNPKFCSRSCAATYNNSIKPKRVKLPRSKCKQCGKECSRQATSYCSTSCQRKHQRLTSIKDGSAGIVAIRSHLRIDLGLSSCSVCGLDTWNDKPIPLEVDHIDGNSENNSVTNLRLICPNCHAQTETYKNKNKGSGRHYRRQRYKEGKSY